MLNHAEIPDLEVQEDFLPLAVLFVVVS